MPGKRKKDPAVLELREALERFQDIAEAYRAALDAELAATRSEAEPYEHLVRALERQVEAVRKLEALLDAQVWPEVISLANGSAYVNHARTREYF